MVFLDDFGLAPKGWSRHTRNWNSVPQVWLNPENAENAVQMDGLKEAA